jgi:hypothetical protein
MPDRVTERGARRALEDLLHGKLQSVAWFLARVGGVPEPEVPQSRVRVVPVVMDSVRDRRALHADPELEERVIRPQPKPKKRHVDRDLLAEFRAQNPVCCLRACGEPADPHHLIRRSEHGSDSHENLIALCIDHHVGPEGWHILDPVVWHARFASHLPKVARLKIELALSTMMERRGA